MAPSERPTNEHPAACNRNTFRFAPALLIGFFALFCNFSLRAATFSATLDRDTVAVGETATLTLKVEGGDPSAFPAPPNLPNLQVQGGGTSRSTTFVNGQVSSSISQSFLLTPMQPADFMIPALQVEVGGQRLSSQPLRLKAVKSGTPGAAAAGVEQLAFFKLFVPRAEMFVGEAVSVELQVFIREGVANGENILQSFEAYNGVPVKAEGFSVLKTAHAQRRAARGGNGNYQVATLVTALSPVKTGPLTIASIEVPLVLQLPQSGARRRDQFDPFGMFQRFDERRITLNAEPVQVTVLPLPKENVPANFGGAVGQFSLAVNAGPTNVAVGDPVTVKVEISGRGAFDSVKLPDQSDWGDFKVYPPTTRLDTTDPLGLEGTKTFEQVAVPQSADLKRLPPFSFSFFDPEKKTYRSLSSQALPLVVRPSTSSAVPTIATPARPANGKSGDSAPPTPELVPNKQRLGTLAAATPPWIQQPWCAALLGLPLIAWVGAVTWRKSADSLANNPRLRRQRQVARLLHEGIGQLRSQAAAQDSDGFFATLFRLLQEQLGERLDLPASAITEAVIDEHLRPRGAGEDVLGPLQEMFQNCNLARYAPVKSSQELAALIPRLENVLGKLQQWRA